MEGLGEERLIKPAFIHGVIGECGGFRWISHPSNTFSVIYIYLRVIAHSLSLSSKHRPDKTEILLKRTKNRMSSINPSLESRQALHR